MKSENLTVTIVGGGSSAHVLIPLLSSSGYAVNILTSRPDQWSENIELQRKQDRSSCSPSPRGRETGRLKGGAPDAGAPGFQLPAPPAKVK